MESGDNEPLARRFNLWLPLMRELARQRLRERNKRILIQGVERTHDSPERGGIKSVGSADTAIPHSSLLTPHSSLLAPCSPDVSRETSALCEKGIHILRTETGMQGKVECA